MARAERGQVADPSAALDPRLLTQLYADMLLTRAVDLRAWTLSRQGKAHFVITGRGHEAAQIGSAHALQRGTDVVFPYYRSLGVAISMGMSARDILLGILARADDPSSGGRQLPMHFSKRELNIVSGSSVTGTQIPHAVGAALAARYLGDDSVTVVYFGEATTSKGDFHEGVNFAAVHGLPVVFFCENNGYGISVPMRLQMRVPRVADRAAAYGLPSTTVDGRDPVAVLTAMRVAVQRARDGLGPTLLEATCDRLTPHSSDDNDRLYRSADELQEALARDPVPAFGARLVQLGVLDDVSAQAMRDRASAEVDEATAFAEASPRPLPEHALLGVFGQQAEH